MKKKGELQNLDDQTLKFKPISLAHIGRAPTSKVYALTGIGCSNFAILPRTHELYSHVCSIARHLSPTVRGVQKGVQVAHLRRRRRKASECERLIAAALLPLPETDRILRVPIGRRLLIAQVHMRLEWVETLATLLPVARVLRKHAHLGQTSRRDQIASASVVRGAVALLVGLDEMGWGGVGGEEVGRRAGGSGNGGRGGGRREARAIRGR